MQVNLGWAQTTNRILFQNGQRNFFLKVVNAQITFEKNPSGEVTALVLHQNAVYQRAKNP